MGARILFVLATLLAIALPACGPPRVEAPVFIKANLDVQRIRLENGLDVVFHMDAAFHDVAVNVRYDSGSKDDFPRRSGLAHLVEHLTFRANADARGRDFFALLDEAGSSSHNAFTSRDATEYHEIVPASELPLALWIEARRMSRPLAGVTPEMFDVERRVVLNERRERYENVPFGSIESAALAALFPEWHPYHHAPIGESADLEAATLDDASAFVRTHYLPNNATLVIVGGFDARRAAELVRAYFGGIPGGAAAERKTVALPKHAQSRHIMYEAGVDAPAVEIAWLLPPIGERGWHEIQLAGRAIAGRVKYQMGNEIRGSSTRFMNQALASALLIRFEVAPMVIVGTVVREIDDRLSYLADRYEGLADDKSVLIAATTLQLGDLGTRANRIQEYMSRFGEPNSLQLDLHAYSEVTRASYEDAIERLLIRAPRIVVEVRPNAHAPKAGRPKR
jgi:zinc protease